MSGTERTNKVVMTALMMCLTILSTMLIKIPIPFTQGYVHLGDAMVFLSVVILGIRYGFIAAAFGSAMGDILGGFAAWAPWTFGIKGGMVIIVGICISSAVKAPGAAILGIPVKELAGMVLAGIFMAAGYYWAEGIMYGNFVVAALGIPWNIGQFTVGMAVALILSSALCKTPARKFFTYNTLCVQKKIAS